MHYSIHGYAVDIVLESAGFVAYVLVEGVGVPVDHAYGTSLDALTSAANVLDDEYAEDLN